MAEPAYRAINDGSRVGAHQTATASSSRLVDVDLLEQVVRLARRRILAGEVPPLVRPA
jgi:hypothetical protein